MGPHHLTFVLIGAYRRGRHDHSRRLRPRRPPRAPEYRRHAIALFLLGVLSHHALDVALLNVSGYSYAVFWPLTEYHPPPGDMYRSSDPHTARRETDGPEQPYKHTGTAVTS